MRFSKNTRLFLSYVLPSMIGMLIIGSYSIIDTFFIGQSAGKIGLASVAVSWPLVMLFGAVGDMLGSGSAIIISQSRGSGDIGHAKTIFGNMLCFQVIFCITMMLGIGCFLTTLLEILGATPDLMSGAFRYAKIMVCGSLASMFMMGTSAVIRNDGRPILSMWLTIGGLLLNILLDYIFIFPLKGGIAGAAYATILSQTIISIIGLVYFSTKYTQLRYCAEMFRLKIQNLKDIVISGIPSFGNQFAIIAMLFLHNFQSLRYGGVDGLAAYTVVGAIESLGSLLMTGLALGVQPLVAYLYGGKRHLRKNVMGNMGYYTAFIIGIILMIVSIIGHNVFPELFNLNGNTAQIASQGLVISSTAFLLLGVIRVAGYYYQATGKIRDSSLLIYGDAFFALPLCLFVLPHFFGLNGVWMAMPASRIILFVICCWLWFGKKSAKVKIKYLNKI